MQVCKKLIIVFLLASSACLAAHRPKVGLVLGGGGAKGAAEIGVLKYIEKSQIPIDFIVGTSIGSIVGGLYAVGYNAEQIDSRFRNQEWLSLLTSRDIKSKSIYKHDSTGTRILGFPAGHRKNKKKGFGMMYGDSLTTKFDALTKRHDSIDFNKLPIPFRCIAVDINSFKEVVLDKGYLPLAMRASMSIPFIYKPVAIDTMLLADGGLLNNLPVDVARKMGADIVIAIDLTQKQRKEKNRDIKVSPHPLNTLIRWSITRPDLKKYNQNIKDADIYIHPDLKGYNALEFKRTDIIQMILLGEAAGKKAMPELKKLKKKLASKT